jgi:hypothetical protein
MHRSYRWRSRPDVGQLERNLDELRTTVVRLRHELETKQGAVGRLEVLVRERSNRIDELANTVAVLRDQNRRLNEEADHLAALVRLL